LKNEFFFSKTGFEKKIQLLKQKPVIKVGMDKTGFIKWL
jgi:hypothetical protein